MIKTNAETATMNVENQMRATLNHLKTMEEWVMKGEALNKIPPHTPMGIETLKNTLLREKHWWPKVVACRKLSERGDKKAVEVLEKALMDPHPEVQRAAVEALSSMKSSYARNALYRYLDRCGDDFNRAFVLTNLFA